MSSTPELVAKARELFGRGLDANVALAIEDVDDDEGQNWIRVEVFSSFDWAGRPPVERRLDRRSAQVRLSDPTGRLVRQVGYDAAPRDLDVQRACGELMGALLAELEARKAPPVEVVREPAPVASVAPRPVREVTTHAPPMTRGGTPYERAEDRSTPRRGK